IQLFQAMPLGLLGKKLGQTRVYNAKGEITPVTIVLAGPNRVLQCKTQQTDGYNAVQLGFNDQKEHRLTKPLLGHIKKFNGVAVKRIKEFRDFSKEVKPGDTLGANLFEPGDYVDAIGITKGRGFEGVVKRHHFRGGDSTHGANGDYVVIREAKKRPKGWKPHAAREAAKKAEAKKK